MASIKQKLAQSYDRIADAYLEWVQSKPSSRTEYAARVLTQLPAKANLLELGCGAGTPITEELVKHVGSEGHVVANDISSGQLALARKRCPGATFEGGDMLELQFADESFDAVMSFFAIIHLPRDEQKIMFKRVATWLKPGGWLACNLAAIDSPEIKGNLLGADMFWSSFGIDESRAMLREAGFEIVESEIKTEADEDESDPDHGKRFLWLIARKPHGSASDPGHI